MVRISVEVADDIADELAKLAQRAGATREALLSRWVATAFADHAELEQRAAEGMADLAAGRTVDNEEVMAELEAWAADLEARHRPAQ